MVLNSGAGESTDEVKQQRIAALSAWKTKFKKPPDEEAPVNKVKARLCLRGLDEIDEMTNTGVVPAGPFLSMCTMREPRAMLAASHSP